MIRSVVLFTHVVGMLVLFIGLAVEWLGLESLRRATTSEHAASWVRVQDMLKRVYGIAFGTLLVSGIFLARGVGYFEFAWLRLALGLMVLMALLGLLGGRMVRSRLRAVRAAVGQGGGAGLSALPRLASHPWARASLFMRAAMGLAIVYLMIGKPRLSASLVVTGVAVAAGLAISLSRTAANRQPSDSVHSGIRTAN